MKELNVKIESPFEYDYDGEKTKVDFILIKKPTAKQVGLTSIIRSIFQSNSIMLQKDADIKEIVESIEEVKEAKSKDKRDDSEDEEDEGISWSEAITILYSDHKNIEKLTVTFIELMRSGLFLIDGETKMTKPTIELLDEDDFSKLLGSFVANFTYASMMKS